jgi:hypothetical protein
MPIELHCTDIDADPDPRWKSTTARAFVPESFFDHTCRSLACAATTCPSQTIAPATIRNPGVATVGYPFVINGIDAADGARHERRVESREPSEANQAIYP